ncbi:BES15S03c, partial [Trypanosoma grayi]|uniref:BES15S03c n=1 Tax=Trypanosoma grayi TaxID=71804 RepID=UPI0004F4B6CE
MVAHNMVPSNSGARGRNHPVVTSEKTLNETKEHFKCKEAKGMELQVGVNGKATSHWSRRNAKDELMSAQIDSRGGYYTALTLAAFEDMPFYEANSLVMPATSSWYQGPVPRIVGGSQAPATFATWRTLRRPAYGITQYQDPPRLAGTQYYPCRFWGACYRAISSIIRTKLLLSGNVEENPGP